MSELKTHRIKSISEFHQLRGLPTPEHPLISVVDFAKIRRPDELSQTLWTLDFFQISLKQGIDAKIKYGQQKYDFDDGVMFFISPNQVFRIEPGTDNKTKKEGWMLLIHPDFLWGSALAKQLVKYEFFEYSVNEALFVSEKEKKIINAIVSNIKNECSANIDNFSQGIIISQIETLLNYSERFYNRQFITRKVTNHKILSGLEDVLTKYFTENTLVVSGLPTVQYLADALHISPKYLSKVLKVLTGQTTQQHIHNKVIDKAKERLSTTDLSVSEIAFELGFEHPQSFSKLFKSKTDVSPLEFRKNFHVN